MFKAWKYRIYPSKNQQKEIDNYFYECKDPWNSLLGHTKDYYKESGKFPTKGQLFQFTKETSLFSQVAQNIADRLMKSLNGMISRKKAGKRWGFPRFKSIERVRSFTYPQFGFKLERKLQLSGIGRISIKKHRNLKGNLKTLTIKKTPSGKYFAIFITETEPTKPKKNKGSKVGMDLGIEHFAYLSNGESIENPRHLKRAEEKLKQIQRRLSNKKKCSKNRGKARLRIALAHEKLANKRRDFLHKVSRKLVEKYSFLAIENLDISGLSRGFLAKYVLDCSWAEFISMILYKAEGASCEIILVDPANTSQECSSCGLIQKKTLAQRSHKCICGTVMHRDLNAARNILIRGTLGHRETNAWEEENSSSFKEPRSPALTC